jgi:hypothetical protein
MRPPPVRPISSLSVRRRSHSLLFPKLPSSSRPLCSASHLTSAPSSVASPRSAIPGQGAKPSPLPQAPTAHQVAQRPTHRGYRAANRAHATGHPLQSTAAVTKPSSEPLPSPNPPKPAHHRIVVLPDLFPSVPRHRNRPAPPPVTAASPPLFQLSRPKGPSGPSRFHRLRQGPPRA